jgi:LysR family transcriptional regulator for metE and metH
MKRIEIGLPQPALEVRDLRLALALAEAGTTARAAALLHITQPAVSRALCAMEERLGAALFERTPRGLVATAAGERLLGGAERILAELVGLERQVRGPAPAPARVRLVCECYTAYHWLPTALVSMRSSLPELEVALAVEHTGDPVAAMLDGKVDVALLTSSPAPRGRLRERRLFSDEVVFIVAASHPLAGRRVITPGDLRDYPLVTSRTPVEEARWFRAQVFGKERPKLRFEQFPLTEAILDVVRAGLGIAVLSEWIASPHLGKGDLVARRLASGPLRRPWRLAWRPEFEDAALRLLAALVSTVPRARLAA